MARTKGANGKEHDAKVQFVRKLICEYQPPGVIKLLFAERFKCAPRTAMDYYTIAKAEILAEYGADSADEMRAMTAEYFRKVGSSTKASSALRMHAVEQIVKLFGLNQPLKVAATTSDGKDIPQESFSPGDARAKARALLDELRQVQPSDAK